jgi:protein gp37
MDYLGILEWREEVNKTKIEWADYTWNPVTGCLHDCEYCYAKKIVNRFGLTILPKLGDIGMDGASKYDSPAGLDTMLELAKPYKDSNGKLNNYPYSFYPTLHKYRLLEPFYETTPKNPKDIFVCSMADLFGDWVPSQWIKAVLETCYHANWNTYYFLTKNPKRYKEFEEDFLKLECVGACTPWLGITVTNENDLLNANFEGMSNRKIFLSVEPIKDFLDMYESFHCENCKCIYDWVIVGAETGSKKNKVIPKIEWLQEIVNCCEDYGLPLFMKNDPEGVLRKIYGKNLIQEKP